MSTHSLPGELPTQSPEQTELAVTASHISLAQQALRDSALSETSEAHWDLAERRHAMAVGVANYQIVRSLLNEFPKSHYSRHYTSDMRVDDPYAVRQVLAGVVFYRGDFPEYMIGQQQLPDQKWTNVLLTPVPFETTGDKESTTLIKTTTVKTAKLEEHEASTNGHLTRPLAAEEVSPLFDAATNQFIIRGDKTAGAAQILDRDTKGGRFRNAPRTEELPAGQIPEQIWQDMNVAKRLAALAVIFDRTVLLDELLASRSIASEPSPTEKFVSES